MSKSESKTKQKERIQEILSKYRKAGEISIGAKEIVRKIVIPGANAYDILEDILKVNDKSESSYMSPIIRRFFDKNLYYRSNLKGITKSFPLHVYSSTNLTAMPMVDENKTSGVSFNFPQSPMNVTEGLNIFEIEITVTSSQITANFGEIYFIEMDTQTVIQSANISYFSITQFPRANVLFDTSHDNDTAAAYYAGHGPRGQLTRFGKVLEREGHAVYEHRSGLISESVLAAYDILVIE